VTSRCVLVTGGTGFVGANLVRHLLNEGHEIHLLLRPTYNPWRIEEIQKTVCTHCVDTRDVEGLQQLIKTVRPSWVFHLAAYGAYSFQKDLPDMMNTNVYLTVNLLNACANPGVDAFIYTGSSSEYGIKDHPTSEDERINPNSYYAITKASATFFCQHQAEQTNLPISIARLYSVYGPYEEPARLIPNLVIRGMRKAFPSLVNPDIARDFIYVEDVCSALTALANASDRIHPGEIFNICANQQVSIRELVHIASRLFEIQQEPDWGSYPARQWDTTHWSGLNSKIHTTTGWSPAVSLQDGLSKFRQWFQDNENWRSFYESAIFGEVQDHGHR
jgi:UDP-glucose 4-epimerase